VAVASDVGAWRVLEPVIRELARRGRPPRLMLAEPAASYARAEGFACQRLGQATLDERAAAVLAAGPAALLLGTSPSEVVERTLGRAAAGRVPTVAVLDALLFAERRFGPKLAGLPSLVACPDQDTAERLAASGAPRAGLVVTGSPALEALAARLAADRSFAGEQAVPPVMSDQCGPASPSDRSGPASPGRQLCPALPDDQHGSASPVGRSGPALPDDQHGAAWPSGRSGGAGQPLDLLFVSQPVFRLGQPDSPFALDERQSLADLLDVLGGLRDLAADGFRVRVRWHPVQRAERLPQPPAGIWLAPDAQADRLRSVARAQVVVGISSSLLAEARLVPRAAIAYLPGDYWRRQAPFAAGLGVGLADSPAQLARLLRRALTAPPAPSPADQHRGAASRVADLLAPPPGGR
jgi:hypothetical protein